MLDAVGIAAIPHARCQPISQPQLLLHAPEQKHARIRRQLPAVKANAHLLAGNRWKVKRKYGIFAQDRKSTRLNSSHTVISYAVFCLKKKSTSRDIVAPKM